MFSYIEPDFIEKFYWGSVFFFIQILDKIEMMQNKHRLSGGHFETEEHLFYFVLFFHFIYLFIYLSIYVCIYLFCFLQNCDFLYRTYMVQISLQNSGGKVEGFHGIPLGTNGSKSTLVT